MGKRLNQERQLELEPKRTEYAKEQIEKLGYNVTVFNNNELEFTYKDKVITFWPYSGWATGKTIKDCRGLNNLIKQIT